MGLRSIALTALALAFVIASPTASSAVARSSPADHAATASAARLDPGTESTPKPDVRTITFKSLALGRTMPYSIYLPPGYATSKRGYPVLYMLHGMSGTNDEWREYGIFDAADRMIRAGEIRPLIIVLPQGDKAYWVDHALPKDQEKWGQYMAKDVVSDVDARYRTIVDVSRRAIGGVSMGAHGAVQLAINYPGTFAVVGAHSLVLRRYDTAPTYFGSQTDWSKRDPMQLVETKTALVKSLRLWVDIGSDDPWAKLAEQFNGELNTLGVAHQWHEWSGDHSASYWCRHLADYLRYYDAALSSPIDGADGSIHFV
jgi:enterochelin esterase-like enzyme